MHTDEIDLKLKLRNENEQNQNREQNVLDVNASNYHCRLVNLSLVAAKRAPSFAISTFIIK